MKKKISIILAALLLLNVKYCAAQQSEETTIRSIENAEREAILKGDTTMLLQLLSPHVVVHNPENAIVTFDQIIKRIRNGKIDYSSFERNIERISFVENIAIVMGKEIITAEGVTTHAGKKVTRSFTNIWMKTEAGWKLTARQASIIAVE